MSLQTVLNAFEPEPGGILEIIDEAHWVTVENRGRGRYRVMLDGKPFDPRTEAEIRDNRKWPLTWQKLAGKIAGFLA